jgi:hypothetical protein
MTRCPSKLFLAVVLGAGALCLGSIAALAGDKIAFSWSSEKSLAMPAVVHPDDHADDLAFGHSSMDPVLDLDFVPQTATVSILPRAHSKKQNGLDGKSDSLMGDRQTDDPWRSADEQGDDNSDDASNSSTNQLKYSLQKGWNSSSQKADDLDLGYGKDGSAQDSSDIDSRRDRQTDTVLGKNGEKGLPGQMDGSSSRSFGSPRQSVMEILRGQSQYSEELEMYKHNLGSDQPESYGALDQSPLSSTSPLRDADRPSESQFSPVNTYSPEETSTRQALGLQVPPPETHAWQTPPSSDPGSQYNPAPAYVPPPPVQSTSQSHPAVLKWPGMPGAIN